MLIYPSTFLRRPVIWDTGKKGTNVTLSNGDRDAVGAAGECVFANIGKSTGKWYYEIVLSAVTAGSAARAGGANHTSYNSYHTTVSEGYGVRGKNTSFLAAGVTANATTDLSGTDAANDVFMFALDMDSGKFWTGKNNTWHNSGDPGAGTNYQYSGLTGTHYPVASFVDTTQKWQIAGDPGNITYSIPSGFSLLG